jgi:hypothetical protein
MKLIIHQSFFFFFFLFFLFFFLIFFYFDLWFLSCGGNHNWRVGFVGDLT